MKKTLIASLFATAALVGMPMLALAQAQPAPAGGGDNVQYRSKTTYDLTLQVLLHRVKETRGLAAGGGAMVEGQR